MACIHGIKISYQLKELKLREFCPGNNFAEHIDRVKQDFRIQNQ